VTRRRGADPPRRTGSIP